MQEGGPKVMSDQRLSSCGTMSGGKHRNTKAEVVDRTSLPAVDKHNLPAVGRHSVHAVGRHSLPAAVVGRHKKNATWYDFVF